MKPLKETFYNTAVPHGRGILVWPNGKVIYEGNFIDGKPHGKGR